MTAPIKASDRPARLTRDGEDGRAQVGRGGDEVERVLVVDPDDADEDNGEHNTEGGRRRQRRKRPTLATKPICVLNLGATRADRYGVTPLLRVNLPCDEALWECVRPGN